MRYARESVVLGGNTPLPMDVYGAQIIEATIKTGQKENAKPTLRVTLELINPPSVTVGGQTYSVAGRRVFMMPNLLDSDVPYGMGAIMQGLDKSKFDYTRFNPEGEFDTDKVAAMVGHKLLISCGTKEEFLTRPAKEGEPTEVVEQGVSSVYIRDNKGERMSRGHFVVNKKGQSPGWNDIVGPYDDGAAF